MASIRHLTASNVLFATMLAATCGAAHAQLADIPYHDIHPANGGSTADTFYALFPVNCGIPMLHPDRPPVVTRTPPGDGVTGAVEQVFIEYFVVDPGDVVCPAVMLPDTLIPIEIGHLLEGETSIMQTFTLVDTAGEPSGHPVGVSWLHWALVRDTPNPAVSGTWFDPTAPGVGVSLSLAPDPGQDKPTAVLFLATLSPEGEPLWLTGSGKFEDATLQVALTRSSAGAQGDAIDTTPAGTATFEYLGCDEARLSVQGIDVLFPTGDATLQQLTHTFGLPSCQPPTTRAFTH